MSDIKVPEGYKQTEIGVIPNDWLISEMRELTTLMTNGFVGIAKLHYTASSNGVLYIQGYNVKENSFNFHGIKRVTPSFHTKNSKSCLKTGDVLMVQTGDVGMTTVVPPELENSNCHALIINRFKNKLNSTYFSYYFNSIQGRARLKEIEVGTTMKHINVGSLLSFIVPVPPKSEQTAIATALSDIDNLIGSLEKLIAKKEAIKTGTMQQLLTGKTRLPEFSTRKDGSPKGFKQTELGRIPEDWEVVRIIDNHIIATGNTPPTNDQRNYKGKFLFVSPADLGNNKLIHNTQKKLSLKGFKLARKFPKGSTLFTCIGSTIGKTGLATCELTSNQQINAVFPNEIDDFEFTYYALAHHSKRIKNKASEQAVPLINKTEFGQFEYMQPNELKEQTAIATILADMDAEIQALQQRLEKTKDIKQGMMQQLLTGKVRLVDSYAKSDTQTLASKGELQA